MRCQQQETNHGVLASAPAASLSPAAGQRNLEVRAKDAGFFSEGTPPRPARRSFFEVFGCISSIYKVFLIKVPNKILPN